MMSTQKQRWGIIGGGFLGMTLAHRLAQQGKSITLFEAASHLGGLASAWNLGEIVWDRHYHVTLLSDGYLRRLLRELNLDEEVQWVQTRTGFYTDGQLYSMSNTLEFLRFPPLGASSKLRLGATIFYASKIRNWRELEKISVADWLTRWSGKRTFEKIWLPLLRAKLGDSYEKASAAFIWAIIARMYAARRTGLKKEMFGYVPGGYARVLARYAQLLAQNSVRIKHQHAARLIESDPRCGVRITFADGHEETFDRVVVTVAAPYALQLCPGLTADEKSRLSDIRYQGILCASALLKKPLAGYYVTNITDSWVPFTAVIEMTALVDAKHFNGATLVYLPKYVAPDDQAFCQSDEEIKRSFLDALTRMYPHVSGDDVLSFRISRVRYVLAIPTLNYSTRLPSMTTSLPGVHIVNSAHIVNGTLNVNETIQLAENAAAALQ